ncbi:hypothetical protein DMUE_6324, partial [Dictyocoela muelleri]
CNLVKYQRNKDDVAWRCLNKHCQNYKKYLSVRLNTFFSFSSADLRQIFKIVIKYAVRAPLYSIKLHFNKKTRFIDKVIHKIVDIIPEVDFKNDKLGGAGRIVQIDETMLNYKCKSHRGRSPLNKTDALCIVEIEGRIIRAFATIIPDKRKDTIIPIIMNQVAPNSIIWTDEHRTYSCLKNYTYEHDTVCHKYQFINHISGTNTQGVESFNNELKLEIKRRK